MKSLLVILALLVGGSAYADNGRDECVQGESEIRFGKAYTCYSGRWVLAKPILRKCKEGSQQYFPVRGVYHGDNEVGALATCKGGKWLFANPAYNYKRTKGVNKCKEGSTWTNGDTRDSNYENYVCRNGKAVRTN